jgi:hypothetical protein
LSLHRGRFDDYAAVSREEIWSDGSLVERRVSWGTSRWDGSAFAGQDSLDPSLAATCESAFETLQELPRRTDARVRLFAEASTDGVAAYAVVSMGGLSVVTNAADALADLDLLSRLAAEEPAGAPPRDLPIVWRNGSAALLLHEAAGHPAEYGRDPARWPDWLRLSDRGADLLRGAFPPCWRRATFRDVPLRRMSDLRVEESAAPFELPATRLEVLLVDGGSYEPLDEMVSIRVAAARLVEGSGSHPVTPFELRCSRHDIAGSLRGAGGPVRRYPGVICSREGQELFVGSSAPDLIMEIALP